MQENNVILEEEIIGVHESFYETKEDGSLHVWSEKIKTEHIADFIGMSNIEFDQALMEAYSKGLKSADVLRERGFFVLMQETFVNQKLTELSVSDFKISLIKFVKDWENELAA